MCRKKKIQSPNPFKLIPSSLKIALSDPLRKPLLQFWAEIVAFWVVKKEIPFNYVHKFLYRKGITRPNDYLSDGQKAKLRIRATRSVSVSKLDNKLEFWSFFNETGLRLPQYYGHTEGDSFHDAGGGIQKISGRQSLRYIASTILNQERTSFFAKPIISYGGHGAFKVSAGSDYDALLEAIGEIGYLFQESLVQHPALAAVYAPSLNTMRVITCISPSNGRIQIGSAYIRFGRGGNFVDNTTSGGIRAGVDLTSGVICTPGSEDIHLGGRLFEKHPDTGVRLIGFKIPFFNECMETAIEASRYLGYPLVGWDIAVSPTGPVLVEGNSRPNHHGSEIASGPYMRNPIMRSFIRELMGSRGL